MATAFERALETGGLGGVNLSTLAVWLASWVFALAAHTGFRRALRGARDREVAAGLRAYALVLSAAALWIALHLARYGLVGLRTWRW